MDDRWAPPTFNRDRPAGVHVPSRTNPYRHYIQALATQLSESSRDLSVSSETSVLDYGCANLPYRHFFPPDCEYVGADLAGNPDAALVLNDDGTLPVEDESYDTIVSTQVLEHVVDPRLYVSECFRAIKPGGRMMLSTHGTFVYHPDPEDYWRWTSAGLSKLIGDAGFEIRRLDGVLGLLATALQLGQDALYWKVPERLRALLVIAVQPLVAIADRAQGRGSKRNNASVYVVVAEKPQSPR